ncbi:MAG TPA: mechanosensitive ion channel domain-containing protein [Aromatoleum sp.]|uniref:mechanosensitive ion channel family protein n=1 Tax=Aromatoleum sp. TaxID=2307007 RepID=UPI002B484AC8|nr:mechanosensitive ion channel domain-containing protein [Aromatoleum sp.]HJV24651.1 mechanosensitive ion channel domain-containing protein [Aromatoleum sp.]
MEALGTLLATNAWFSLLLQCATAAIVGLLLHGLLDRIARRAAQRYVLADRVVWHTRRPAQVLIPLLFVHLALADASVPAGVLGGLRQLLSIAVILTVTLFVVRLIAATADYVALRHPTTGTDNLRARSVQTQVRVLARTAMFTVGLLGVGSVLMTFPNVRQIGASVMASAGVAGIVAGLAARPVLGNLIAGLQIALTQPIRVDDVLIVEDEWGRVEEITSTYVVIRIWDDRRLIVPLEYFIQHPFQNWTRSTSDLIGEVFFWVDYRMPVQPLRDALRRIVEAAPEWDRRVCVLQVTDFSDRAMKLRALVSSADSGRGWDLRCKVREHLVAYMQEHHPRWLPQLRATVDRAPREEADPAFHPPPPGRVQESAHAPPP